VHEKPPVEFEEQVEGADAPFSMKVIVLEAANPVPVAVVMLPTTPLVGLNENNASTANVAEALFTESDAFIVCAPFGTAGMVSRHRNPPVEFDEQADGADTPSSVNVIDPLAANPAPVAVVELPTIPLVGFSERDALTVNVADALFTESDAFIVCAPFGTAGMLTGHEKPPVMFEEQVEGADTPSSVNVIDPPTANPAPVAVVVLPTIPLIGLSVNVGPISGARCPADPFAGGPEMGVTPIAKSPVAANSTEARMAQLNRRTVFPERRSVAGHRHRSWGKVGRRARRACTISRPQPGEAQHSLPIGS